MPLIDPVTMGNSGDKSSEWMNKLAGKKLGDSASSTVRSCSVSSSGVFLLQLMFDGHKTFAKQDLPKEHRVLEHGSMSTMDFKPERYDLAGNSVPTLANLSALG